MTPFLPGMVGCGRSSVAEVCDISRANVADGMHSKAIYGLNSLGGNGVHEQTQERDLHRWVKGLHGMNLEPLEVTMNLNVSWILEKEFFKLIIYFSPFSR